MTEHGEFNQPELTGLATDVIGATWAAVLGCTTIDPDVGFFDLGAVSADVMVVVNLLRARWPGLRVVDIFLYPTATTLAAFLEGQPTADG